MHCRIIPIQAGNVINDYFYKYIRPLNHIHICQDACVKLIYKALISFKYLFHVGMFNYLIELSIILRPFI